MMIGQILKLWIQELEVSCQLFSKPSGSYVREAYLNGLTLEFTRQGNPYKFGLIGSTDTKVVAASLDESNYWSKVGLL